MARSGRAERLRACRAELSEPPDRRSHRNDHLRGHSGRLVRGLRTGTEFAGWVCLARFEVHPGGPGRIAANRISAPPANYLEQGQGCSHTNTLLVRSRALLVRQKEECPVVRKSRRKYDSLGIGRAHV